MKGQHFFVYRRVILLGLLLLWSANISAAQITRNRSVDGVPSPETEKFLENKDLIVPWRDTDCLHWHGVDNFEEWRREGGECSQVTAVDRMRTHRLSIFNSDGSLWYRFSVLYDEADYFGKNSKIGFVPFSKFVSDEWPDGFVLRLAGESTHWYEVEVNESTKETKFIPKKDPLWAKVSWSSWLLTNPLMYIDNDLIKLRDKPNGDVVEGFESYQHGGLVFLKGDGDWALVRGGNGGKQYQGWIHWKEGRKLLVGCTFNHLKVPSN